MNSESHPPTYSHEPQPITEEALLDRPPRPTFAEALRCAAVNGAEFLAMQIPERKRLVGDWFREGDLGFIFAPRGVGKTWLAHALVAQLSAGRDFEDWPVPEAVRVCLLDGEMPPDAVQDRLKRLEVNGENLVVLSHQFLFELADRSFQIGDAEQRTALLDFCKKEKIRVLVIDNLSSVSNVSENDNDAWPDIGSWLLDFRRNGISVIVIHHSGRNGAMRGASRREDPAFWIIRLDDSRERTATTEGARFVTTFTKNRNSARCPDPIDWHFITNEEGTFTIETEAADNSTLVYQAIKDGTEQCSEIADETGLSRGAVSKIAKRLESNGLIRIVNRRYLAN